MREIPFTASESPYLVSTVLNGEQVTFDVHWNARDAAWYFSLLDSTGAAIVSGVKVVLGVMLGRGSTHQFFAKNLLKAFDLSGKNREAGIDDLGSRVIVLHATSDEVEGVGVTILFDRTCQVTIYRPDGLPLESPRTSGGFGGAANVFFERLNNGVTVTGLRMVFQIEKAISAEPNTCDLTIYNLAERTRALMQQAPLTVRIDAGYGGVNRNLFLGNVKYTDNKLKGTEWETKIQLLDGGRAFANARVNHSYKSGTPVRTILADAARSMGLSLPRELAADRALDTRIPRGGVLEGPTRDELTRILAPYGYSWSVQNGQLQILRDTETSSTRAHVISEADAGLTGTPEYGQPDKTTGKGGASSKKRSSLTFTCLLFPELVPGGKVEMKSRFVNGLHRLSRVVHHGDTHGQPWSTTCEAKLWSPEPA